jgi:2'-5' RNA ligase
VDKKVLQFKLWMRDRFGCTVALKSPAHITLIAPFWLKEQGEIQLLEVLRTFSSDIDELKIEMEGFSHFGRRVLYIHVKENPGIEELSSQVQDHFIRSFGNAIKKDDRPFHPHITIATRDIKPDAFAKAWEHFSKQEFVSMFTTRTVNLLKLSPGRWNVIAEKKW